MDVTFAAFLGVSAVVVMTPGQNTALTIRNTLLGGRTARTSTAAGVALGQAVRTLAASRGLTALLVASESAFAAVRRRAFDAIVGAILIALGVRLAAEQR